MEGQILGKGFFKTHSPFHFFISSLFFFELNYKSSLLNALTLHTNLFKTSNTPGRTQTLNFYKVGVESEKRGEEKRVNRIVDLPGYGYAKAPLSIVNTWNVLIDDYLTVKSRDRNVVRVLVLIDSRLSLRKSDFEMMNLLERNLGRNCTFQPILTKIDKVPKQQVDSLLCGIAHQCTLSSYKKLYPLVLGTSSKTFTGVNQLRLLLYHCFQDLPFQ